MSALFDRPDQTVGIVEDRIEKLPVRNLQRPEQRRHFVGRAIVQTQDGPHLIDHGVIPKWDVGKDADGEIQLGEQSAIQGGSREIADQRRIKPNPV